MIRVSWSQTNQVYMLLHGDSILPLDGRYLFPTLTELREALDRKGLEITKKGEVLKKANGSAER